jgi:hypothetical protein
MTRTDDTPSHPELVRPPDDNGIGYRAVCDRVARILVSHAPASKSDRTDLTCD